MNARSNLAETPPNSGPFWSPEKQFEAFLDLADQAKAAADRSLAQYEHLLSVERKYHRAAFRLIRDMREKLTPGDSHGR